MKRNKTVGYVLAFFLGVLGIHAFYYKRYFRGTIYALISLFVTSFAPFVMILGWIDMFFIKKWHEQLGLTKGNQLETQQSRLKNEIKQNNDTSDKKEKPKKLPDKKVIKNSIFYNEKEHILNKYAHLRTPSYIIKSVDRVLTKKDNSAEYSFYISTSNTDFIRDSYKYRKKTRTKTTREIPLQVYWTTFNNLNDRQLDWYIYWRTQILNKNYLDADLSYIILFSYELINYSFNSNAAFNVSMIETLYEKYHEREPKLNNYFPQWIADMLYELEQEDLAEKWASSNDNIPKLYTILKENNPLEEVSMTIWNSYIKYGRRTTFFNEYRARVYNIFKKNIGFLEEYYSNRNESLIERWFETKEERSVHHLYRSAVIGREADAIHVSVINFNPKETLLEEVTALMKYSENIYREIKNIPSRVKVKEELLAEVLKNTIRDHHIKNQWSQNKQNKKSDKDDRFKVVKYESNVNKEIEGKIPTPPIPVTANETPNLSTFFDSNKIDDLKTQTDELVDIFTDELEINDEDSENNPPKDKVKPDSDIHALFSENLTEENDYLDFLNSLSEQEENFLKLCSKSNGHKTSNLEATKYVQRYNLMLGVFLSELNNKAIEYMGEVILQTIGEEIVLDEEFEVLIEILEEGVVNEN